MVRRSFLSSLGLLLVPFDALAPFNALAEGVLPQSEGETGAALAAIATARKGQKSLVAPFKQTRVVGLLAEAVESKGELCVVMPTDLRWELFAPDNVIYWVSKSGVAYKTAKAAKATQAPSGGGFNAMLGDLLAFLSGDVASLGSRYELAAKVESDGAVSVTALPKEAALKKAVSKIAMRTNPEKWGVSKVIIEEPSGDQSTIVFDANQRNVSVDPAKMRAPV